MYEHIDITEDSGITTITLNRPEKLNALAGHMRRDLAEALEAPAAERNVHVVVITGAGRAFCAGGDVAAMAELIERQRRRRVFASAGFGSPRDHGNSPDDETGGCFDQWSGVRRGLQSRARLRSAHRLDRRYLQPIVCESGSASGLGRHLFPAATGHSKQSLRNVFPWRNDERGRGAASGRRELRRRARGIGSGDAPARGTFARCAGRLRWAQPNRPST